MYLYEMYKYLSIINVTVRESLNILTGVNTYLLFILTIYDLIKCEMH